MARILIADDQLAMRNMFKSIFAGTKFEIDLAVDGEDAFKKATATQYDAILTDLYMPKLDGMV